MIQPHHRDRLGIHVMIKTDGSPTDVSYSFPSEAFNFVYFTLIFFLFFSFLKPC